MGRGGVHTHYTNLQFRLDTRKNFLREREAKHWKGLRRAVVGSPALEVLRKCVDAAPRDGVSDGTR